MRNNAAFDLDSTLVCLGSVLYPVLSIMVGQDIEKYYGEVRNFELERAEIGLTTDVVLKALEITYSFYDYLPIYEGVYELFSYMYGNTLEPIHIVTARPIKYSYYTHKLVIRIMQGIPYHITFTNNKLQYLKNYEYFVDDRRKTVIELANAGKFLFVPRENYNGGIEHINVVYISCFKELLKYKRLFIC